MFEPRKPEASPIAARPSGERFRQRLEGRASRRARTARDAGAPLVGRANRSVRPAATEPSRCSS
ncbi:MAG TPA: hypothetical protein DCQ98_15225 [Planctomycetaceae bacterium]|nr:hypothetical protein [Planctomycetaceae bacterium]